MADAVSQLATQIANISVAQNTLQQNISPNDPSVGYVVAYSQNVLATGITVAASLTLATDSFIVNHPFYGNVNSAVFKINGGYKAGSLTIPATMPIVFDKIRTILYTSTW